MRILNNSIKSYAMVTGLAAMVYLGHRYTQDIANVDRIKEDIKKHPYSQIDKYAPAIEVIVAESSEPILNKTAYWDYEAERIKSKFDKKYEMYKRSHKSSIKVHNFYEMDIINLANSNSLKYFMEQQDIYRKKDLNENPNLKLVHTKDLQLDSTFPTKHLYELGDILLSDSDWIPKNITGYTQKKEKIKVKNGNSYKYKTKTVKEPIYKLAYKNISVYLENEIKENEKGKYLTCNYYAEQND